MVIVLAACKIKVTRAVCRGGWHSLGDRLLGDPPLARSARRRRLGELGPVHVLDRVDLGQEELLRQLVSAVHLDL